MAVTLEDLAARVEALERAQTATPVSYYTSRYSGEEMDERLDAVGVLGGSTQQALANLGAGVRPNLLDNPYFVGGGTGWGVFPVNQVGFKSADMYDTATFDRWRLYSYTSGAVTLTENGVNLNGQFDYGVTLEHSRIPEIPNLPITISALTSDWALITATGILQNNGQTENFGIPFENGITANLIFIRRWNVDYLDLFFFQLTAPTETTIIAAKLEIGDTQTLAYQDEEGVWHLLPQPDMDYSTQLRKCQYYFEEIPIWTGLSAGDQFGSFDLFVPFKSTKRTVPTITVSTFSTGKSGMAEFWDGESWNSFDVTTVQNTNGFRVFGPTNRAYSPVQFKAVVSAEL